MNGKIFELTPKWQQYFLTIAETVAAGSPCLSRKVGAVLVTPDHQIISTGYNGPPRGVPHCFDGPDGTVCPRRVRAFPSGEGLHLCPAAHAERNALIQAARHGVRTRNSILCLTCGIPCKDCLIEIINAGVRTIYVTSREQYDYLTGFFLHHGALQILTYDHLRS